MDGQILSQVIPRLQHGLTLCQETHVPSMLPYIAAHLGYVYTLSGRLDEALALLEQAEERAVAMRAEVFRSLHVAWLNETYLLAGRPQEAVEQARRALALCRDHHERGSEAWILRLLGTIASQHNPPEIEAAATHYQQALTLARALCMRPLQAHCHCGLGTLYSQTGQREQARVELSTAIDMYRGMEMMFWLPQAKTALGK